MINILTVNNDIFIFFFNHIWLSISEMLTLVCHNYDFIILIYQSVCVCVSEMGFHLNKIIEQQYYTCS